MNFVRRLSLQYRIAAGVVLGLVILFSLFGYLAVRIINQSRDVALEERLSLAEAMAYSVDNLVQHAISQLEAAAHLQAPDPDDLELEQMRRLYGVLGTYETIVRLDAQGHVLWTVSSPTADSGWAFEDNPQIMEALKTDRTSVVQPLSPLPSDQPPIAIVITPIPDGEGGTAGFLAGELHTAHGDLTLVPLVQQGETGHVEIVDSRGYIIAHPEYEDISKVDEHAEILAPLIAEGQAGTRVHHVGGGRDHVVAYHPLQTLPGGVVVEQREDEALALPRDMQRTVLYFGLGALFVASVAAWLHARSVVRPIRELTEASSRIAAGALDTPIVSRRDDEVGELARSFESMRVELKAHLEERQRWEQELEGRVRERTREVNWLLGKVITAQEEERKRIARELHDDSAQALATLLVGIQTADEALPESAMEAKAALARVKPQATRALEEMRKMILDLRPSALDDLGLASAIRWYAESSLEAAGVAVSCEVSGREKRLPGPVETALFRMAQEAINNIVKHAEAHNAQLQLRFAARKVVIDVEDDGKGFDVQEVAASTDETRGLGLLGMKERAALFGGSVHVESKLGRGTRIHIEVPLVEDGEDTDTASR